MPSSNYDLIRQAIINREQVIAVYQGHEREMCPHVLGLKDEKEQTLFCQFGGYSGSAGVITPDSPLWRCLFVDELSDVSIRRGPWYTVDTHTERQTCVGTIDVEVDWTTP